LDVVHLLTAVTLSHLIIWTLGHIVGLRTQIHPFGLYGRPTCTCDYELSAASRPSAVRPAT